jgi:hypothetical protein
MFLLLTVVLVVISASGFLAVQAEVARQRPGEPFNSLRNRMAVDDYVWGGEASKDLKRKYIFTSACFPIAMLSLTGHFLFHSEQIIKHPELPGLSITFSIITATWLLWKVVRHGF